VAGADETSGAGWDTHAAAPARGGSTGFQRSARRLSQLAGSGGAAAAVTAAGCAWLVVGVSTGFPRWWELVVTIGLPIMTLLMIVLLQHTQNHDSRATQLKLDELIRVSEGATNRMMTVEDASANDLDRIQDDFRDQSGEGEAQQRRNGERLPARWRIPGH
jgi:low affinity Fe/Cu permease